MVVQFDNQNPFGLTENDVLGSFTWDSLPTATTVRFRRCRQRPRIPSRTLPRMLPLSAALTWE